MVIYVDIDGTIATITPDANYSNAQPIQENIDYINGLYEKGHKIIYWTARGTETGIDWRDVTVIQFHQWGVKYHGLKFGKPTYDLFIDDKAINAKEVNKCIL
ncbi:MAG: hypothetical protein WC332_00005 [Clostridia bacterium]|jgi:dTDP-glucose 4,6-dehydratase